MSSTHAVNLFSSILNFFQEITPNNNLNNNNTNNTCCNRNILNDFDLVIKAYKIQDKDLQ